MNIKIILMIIASFVLLPFVSSAEIFFDNFESGGVGAWNLSSVAGGNNWTASTTDPFQGTVHAQSNPQSTSEPASFLHKAISTSGYENINFSYYRKLVGLDIADEFQVEWYNGSVWTILEQTGGSSADELSYSLRSFLLPATADNNANFQIKFECTAGAVSEFCRVENVNISGVVIAGDSIPPNILIVYPTNVSYNLVQTALNYSVGNDAQACWYSTNLGVTNTTITCETNVTGLTSSQGSNTWKVYANDSSNNLNSSSVTFSVDSLFPTFNNFLESLANNSAYSTGQFYEFNVSVTEASIGAVWIEWEGINYSSYGSYRFNRTNLGAGTYSYRWWANDSIGNLNSSELKYYTVAKRTPEGSLTNSGAWSVTYPTALTIGLSESNSGDADVTYVVHRDNVNKGTGETVTLSAGSYVYLLNSSGGQNYTANASMDNRTLIVSQVTGNVALYLNHSSANITLEIGSAIYLNATLIAGEGNVFLYNDENLINSGTNVVNLTTFNSLGSFNVTAIYSGNTNYTSDSETFYVDVVNSSQSGNQTNLTGVAPNITIYYPSFVSTYGNNNSINLNFSVSGQNLSSCWYNVTGVGFSNSALILNCANTSFGVPSNGLYNISVYANESVEVLRDFESILFYVANTEPAIHLLAPDNEHYFNSSSILVRYIPSFSSSVNCSLLGNFAGNYSLFANNNSILLGEENQFNISGVLEGNYSWAIMCNNSAGNSAITGNRTLFSDYTAPVINSSLANGSSFSAGTISLNYSVSDLSPTNCYYNITAKTTSQIVISQETANCKNTIVQINVLISNAGDYNLNIGAQDRAGNVQSSQQSFSVSSSGSSGSSGGSGGGGGGGGGGIAGVARAEFEEVDDFSVKVGESRRVTLVAKNTGERFLNKCKLKFDSAIESWIDNDEEISLASGERGEFNFIMNVPKEANVGGYVPRIELDCNELNIFTRINFEVVNPDLELKILDYERESVDELRVDYTIQYFTGVDDSAEIRYVLSNLQNVVLSEGVESVYVDENLQERSSIVSLPKDSFGEFSLNLSARTSDAYYEVQREIVLSSQGLTGLAISDSNARTLKSFAYWLIGALIVFILFRYVLVHYRRNQPPHKNKHLIPKHYHPPKPYRKGIWKAVFNLKYW